VCVNKFDGQIICACFVNGRCHDFRVFKVSKLEIDSKTELFLDTGYIGVIRFHTNPNFSELRHR
jgi:hypothetical protein